MVRGWTFGILMLGMGLLAIINWAGTAYQNWDDSAKWAHAVAVPVQPPLTEQDVARSKKIVNGVARYQVGLTFKTGTGQAVTATPALGSQWMGPLVKLQKMDLWYLQSDPQTIRFYSGQREPETGFLVVGLILVGIFAFSLKLR